MTIKDSDALTQIERSLDARAQRDIDESSTLEAIQWLFLPWDDEDADERLADPRKLDAIAFELSQLDPAAIDRDWTMSAIRRTLVTNGRWTPPGTDKECLRSADVRAGGGSAAEIAQVACTDAGPTWCRVCLDQRAQSA